MWVYEFTTSKVEKTKNLISAFHKPYLLDLPNEPSKPKAENIDKTTVKITWTPPYNTGGSPVTGYVIEKCDVSKGDWVRVNKKTVSALYQRDLY